ncbi:uncharacterized protein SPSK_01297 [Sporothrix schenckii 1099-18]|uniref:Uncharacterized protein n=1 Tax=Sporothrix schenckii 1099-18 TaxID=1397361 RepID=A0A0F2LWW1_SPOSC|nr:uncharacterized protein SPSK_01297 [Sporothrix schenckii 1099-18]KJR81344.1 hypothetical protein SPSK_01297 [Sporothrix schenckii 1099-18]
MSASCTGASLNSSFFALSRLAGIDEPAILAILTIVSWVFISTVKYVIGTVVTIAVRPSLIGGEYFVLPAKLSMFLGALACGAVGQPRMAPVWFPHEVEAIWSFWILWRPRASRSGKGTIRRRT